MTSQEQTDIREGRRRRIPVLSVVLWVLATWLVAAAPVLYAASGASDDATNVGRTRAAAVPLLLAWVPLALSFGLLRRSRGGRMGLVLGAAAALLLILVAAAVLAYARQLANTTAIFGNRAWALYWTGSFAAWIALSAAYAVAASRRSDS
jgi:hypothetical protein